MSTFAKLLQQAMEQGQVVLIPAPPEPPRPAPPPHHDRGEVSLAALCLAFKLKRSEGQMLVRLLTHSCSTIEELRIAAAHTNKIITIGTTRIFLSALRKKLSAHNIQISTISMLGYGLDGKARSKIEKMLVEHDRARLRPLPQLSADRRLPARPLAELSEKILRVHRACDWPADGQRTGSDRGSDVPRIGRPTLLNSNRNTTETRRSRIACPRPAHGAAR
jgi:hypothetical protein